MKKNLKKKKLSEKIQLKISTLIFLISVIAIAIIIVLSVIGYKKISILSDNIDAMYNDDIGKLEQGRQISIKITAAQTGIKNQLLQYDPNVEATVSDNLTELKDAVTAYSGLLKQNDEKKAATNMTATVNEYINSWKKANKILKKGQKLDDASYAKLRVKEQTIVDDFTRLTSSGKDSAHMKYFKSENVSKSTYKEYLYISAIGLIILIIISIIIGRIVNFYTKQMVSSMETISSGNFSLKVNTDLKNEFGVMYRSLDKTLSSVSNMVSSVKSKTENIVTESQNLDNVANEMLDVTKNVYTATQNMASGSVTQAQDLRSINEEFEDFSSKLNDIVVAIDDLETNNDGIQKLTSVGTNNVDTLVTSSEKVSVSFDGFKKQFEEFSELISEVHGIVEVITEISSQTKLLSLNASIEAARAGEQGKGFAVVATEVSQLSEQSKDSADKITEVIGKISAMSKQIVAVSKEMGEELQNQQDNTKGLTDSLTDIIKNIQSSSAKIDLLNHSVGDIMNEKQNLVDNVEKATTIAEQISSSANDVAESASNMDKYAANVVNTAQNLNGIVYETANALQQFTV